MPRTEGKRRKDCKEAGGNFEDNRNILIVVVVTHVNTFVRHHQMIDYECHLLYIRNTSIKLFKKTL